MVFMLIMCSKAPKDLLKPKKLWGSVGISLKSILKSQFTSFSRFRRRIGKNSRTREIQTVRDMAKKFYRDVSRVNTNIPCKFEQNWRGSLLNFSDIVWLLEKMSLKLLRHPWSSGNIITLAY